MACLDERNQQDEFQGYVRAIKKAIRTDNQIIREEIKQVN